MRVALLCLLSLPLLSGCASTGISPTNKLDVTFSTSSGPVDDEVYVCAKTRSGGLGCLTMDEFLLLVEESRDNSDVEEL